MVGVVLTAFSRMESEEKEKEPPRGEVTLDGDRRELLLPGKSRGDVEERAGDSSELLLPPPPPQPLV